MSDAAEDSIALRRAVIDTARGMNAAGINVNASGNVSVRCMRGDTAGLLITPTALAYDTLQPEDIVFLPLNGTETIGRRAPSSEWHFHQAILRNRVEFNAVVHTHSPKATALACHGLSIPAFHYMVAQAGGSDIRCAPYARFGSEELADHALVALADRKACLLAQHGMIACERSLPQALALAIEIEHLAAMYLQVKTLALALGQHEPPLLSASEMLQVLEKFRGYGR